MSLRQRPQVQAVLHATNGGQLIGCPSSAIASGRAAYRWEFLAARKGFLVRYFLNAVYLLAILLASPWLIARAVRHGKYRDGWSQKLWGRVTLDPDRKSTRLNSSH